MGYLFAYQKETGMGLEEIMKTSWLMIVLGMLTAPSIDYKARKKESTDKNTLKPKTADEEASALNQIFS